jgi:6-phosphogluconolactonase/glucosamine-6-phosphate isomerase/deaminase
VKQKGRFSIGFSGGSLPKLACGTIVSNTSIAWDKWDVFFVDEVRHDHLFLLITLHFA